MRRRLQRLVPGSANLAVACEGKCEGTCQGSCDGTCEGNTDTGGGCNGNCTGKCGGECRGTCQVEANANVECSGECKGECSGTATAPKCQGTVEPPKGECSASAEGDCSATARDAQASAECKPPSLEIVYTGTANVSAQALGTLKLNLPKIFLVGQRATELTADIQAIFQFGANLDPGSFSGEAVLCLPKAIAAITATLGNIKAGGEALRQDRRLLQRAVSTPLHSLCPSLQLSSVQARAPDAASCFLRYRSNSCSTRGWRPAQSRMTTWVLFP